MCRGEMLKLGVYFSTQRMERCEEVILYTSRKGEEQRRREIVGESNWWRK
jgi:hypothetical protein